VDKRLLAATIALALPLASQAQEMRPGHYKMTITTEIQGTKMPTMPEEDCVTKGDIDEGLARLGKDAECKPSDIKRGAGTIAYKVTCVDLGKTSYGQTNGKYTADTFDFNMVIKEPLAMKMHVKGTRSGECKK
jgi:Protein of unknown function (DUF3617)